MLDKPFRCIILESVQRVIQEIVMKKSLYIFECFDLVINEWFSVHCANRKSAEALMNGYSMYPLQYQNISIRSIF